MNIKNHLDEDKEFAIKNCKILYQDIQKPCTETCMCWGWEMGSGFNSVMRELSTRLEMINMLVYPKYGVHVVMEQVKSKFGRLTVYHSTRIESPLIYRIWHIPFSMLYYWMRGNIDYKYKTVVDNPSYTSDETEEVLDSEIDLEKKKYAGCSNVMFKHVNSKWYRITKIYHCQKSHAEPTANRFLNFIEKVAWKLSIILDFHKEPTRKQLIIRDAVDSIAYDLINSAEEKCYDVCEECGTQIGTEWSPRVTTKGWISYICEKCNAKKNIENALSSIKYGVDSSSYKISDEDKNKIDSISEMIHGDKFFSIDDYKSAEKEIDSIHKRIFINRTQSE